ncbi:MAG: peptidoglycan-associated lipoprotein Pal [Rhizobacter sp.]|nr:peptidoglycan-associated lipoprotein Pal [Rhizobacter sp.]
MFGFRVSIAVLSIGALAAGCSSTPDVEVPAATPRAAPAIAAPSTPLPAAPMSAAPTAAPSSQVATVMLAPHLDPKSAISTTRSVYFDFDDFSIRSEFAPLIEQHGKYLASKPALAIKIEGNADERGSPEYNLALGQKRAEAVLKALRVYGVKDAQMEAVSWGEERPVATGHNEAAWALNRHADLMYPKQ